MSTTVRRIDRKWPYMSIGYDFIEDLADFVDGNTAHRLGREIEKATDDQLTLFDNAIAEQLVQEEEYSMAILLAAEDVF